MKTKHYDFCWVMMAILGLLLLANVQFAAAGASVLESACTLVSIKDKSLTVVSLADGKQRVYTIDSDTLFLDSEGKAAAKTSFKPGDPVTVGTELGTDEALSVQKGLTPAGHK